MQLLNKTPYEVALANYSMITVTKEMKENDKFDFSLNCFSLSNFKNSVEVSLFDVTLTSLYLNNSTLEIGFVAYGEIMRISLTGKHKYLSQILMILRSSSSFEEHVIKFPMDTKQIENDLNSSNIEYDPWLDDSIDDEAIAELDEENEESGKSLLSQILNRKL